MKCLSFLCTNLMENCEAMTSSPHSFAYSYRLVNITECFLNQEIKKCFLNICETSKCLNFFIFQPIFIRFSLFCKKTNYSFFWDWVKPVLDFLFKENPRWFFFIELCEFLQVMQKPGKAMGSHIISQMATLLSGTSRNVPSILGFEMIFRPGTLYNLPSISFQTPR